MIMKEQFTEDDISKQISLYKYKAEKVLNDESRANQLFIKIKKWLEKGKNIPVLGSIIDDVIDMISLFSDYISGEYKKIPFGAVVTIVAALIYLISPVDLIPDWIPFIGYLDDVAVVIAVLKSGISIELKKYRKWKMIRQEEENNRAAMICFTEFAQTLEENQRVAAFFLREDLEIEVLLCKEKEIAKPIPCEVHVIMVQNKSLMIEEILTIYNNVIKQIDFPWHEDSCRELIFERDYDSFEEDYYIVEVLD